MPDRWRGADQPALLDDPDAHRVDEAVGAVGLIEVQLAADGRDADAVAVPTDARDHTVEEMALMRLGERTETQRVEQRDRTRAHREDVAQDAADTGRGALVRLDGARVVVRLDLEHACQPMTDVHGAGVLPGTLEDRGPLVGSDPSSGLLVL